MGYEGRPVGSVLLQRDFPGSDRRASVGRRCDAIRHPVGMIVDITPNVQDIAFQMVEEGFHHFSIRINHALVAVPGSPPAFTAHSGILRQEKDAFVVQVGAKGALTLVPPEDHGTPIFVSPARADQAPIIGALELKAGPIYQFGRVSLHIAPNDDLTSPLKEIPNDRQVLKTYNKFFVEKQAFCNFLETTFEDPIHFVRFIDQHFGDPYLKDQVLDTIEMEAKKLPFPQNLNYFFPAITKILFTSEEYEPYLDVILDPKAYDGMGITPPSLEEFIKIRYSGIQLTRHDTKIREEALSTSINDIIEHRPTLNKILQHLYDNGFTGTPRKKLILRLALLAASEPAPEKATWIHQTASALAIDMMDHTPEYKSLNRFRQRYLTNALRDLGYASDNLEIRQLLIKYQITDAEIPILIADFEYRYALSIYGMSLYNESANREVYKYRLGLLERAESLKLRDEQEVPHNEANWAMLLANEKGGTFGFAPFSQIGERNPASYNIEVSPLPNRTIVLYRPFPNGSPVFKVSSGKGRHSREKVSHPSVERVSLEWGTTYSIEGRYFKTPARPTP